MKAKFNILNQKGNQGNQKVQYFDWIDLGKKKTIIVNSSTCNFLQAIFLNIK